MKKCIAFILVVVSFVAMVCSVEAAVVTPLDPQYADANALRVDFSIGPSGLSRILLSCVGNSTLESTNTTVYFQKKVDGAWSSIKTWSDSSEGTTYQKQYTYQLFEQGEYRVLVYFRLAGTTHETIKEIREASY
jgi:hypothetical protein